MRTMLCRLLLSAACFAALSALARADELRLTDGRVVVGSVERKGDVLEVTTRDGVVTVRADEVVARRTDAELRAELKRLGKDRPDDAFSHLQLARTALSFGLEHELWQHLDRCLELLGDADDGPVRRDADALLASLEPEILPPQQRQGDTKARVRAVLHRIRSTTGPAFRAAAIALLVREPEADAELRRAARVETLPAQRVAAATALLQRTEPENAPVAQMAMVWDRDADVRREIAELVAAHGNTREAVRRLSRGLMHESPAIRIRTAEAYAHLGDGSEAVPLLVLAGPAAGTPPQAGGGAGVGTRAHMFSTTSRAYVRDFDVEIAQAAAVANPVVDTLRSGVVLDVAVPAVITQRVEIEHAYRKALHALSGSDPGPDPNAWARWLHQRDPEAAALLGDQ